MVFDTSQIKIAFRKKLLLLGAAIPEKALISTENMGFDPPSPPKPWLRETLLPVVNKLIATDQRMYVGIMQYDVIVPTNTGSAIAEAMAELIVDWFKPASSLIDPVQIAIDRSEALQGRDFDSQRVWWQIPVQITFRSYSTNS